jgi:uncharacterized membrane protein
MRTKELLKMPYGRGFFFGNGMMGGGWLWAVLMGLLWLAIVLGVIFLIVRLVRRDGHGHGPMMMHNMQHGDMGSMTPPTAAQHDEAVAIARKRFASGEITKEQYDEIVKTLG